MTEPTTKPATEPATRSVSTRWPSTPLEAAQRAFDLLVCPPAPLAFDGRAFAGLPQRMLPLDELKKVLNPTNVPEFEAVATTGVGVFDTLKAVAKLVLTELKRGG